MGLALHGNYAERYIPIFFCALGDHSVHITQKDESWSQIFHELQVHLSIFRAVVRKFDFGNEAHGLREEHSKDVGFWWNEN